MRNLLRATAVLALATVTLSVVSGASAWSRKGFTHDENRVFSDMMHLSPDEAAGVGSVGREECVTTGEFGSTAVDKDISCDSPIWPDNELGIAAHPTNPDLLLAGSNDYHLSLGGFFPSRIPAGVFLSQDGGMTWLDTEMPMKASLGAGDPAPAFDLKRNQAVMASLSFVCGQGAPLCSRGNLAVATLDLSRLTPDPADEEQLEWHDRMVVNGEAADVANVQIFNDKEWITVDNYASIPNPRAGQPGQPAMIANPNYGNYYLVWARFRTEKVQPNQDPPPAYDESPIYFTMSRDGGKQWTDPVEISGRHPAYCTFQDDPDDTADRTGDNNPSGISQTPDDPFACDQDQFAYPVVAPDGTLYVHFHNEQHLAAYELPQRYDSQIMIVKSDDGGATFYGEPPTPGNQQGCVRQVNQVRGKPAPGYNNPCVVPIHVVDMEDSYDSGSQSDDGSQTTIADYPINVQGRTTLTNMQFRVNSAGTITVAKGAAPGQYRLYVVYADNCAGVRPGFGPTPPPSQDPTVPPVPLPTAVTDTNLYYAYSDDGGNTWIGGDGQPTNPQINSCSTPAQLVTSGRLLMKPGPDTAATGTYPDDQWFPWIDGNSHGQTQTGRVVAMTMDGNQFDGLARETYGITAWENAGGATVGPPNFEGPHDLAGAPSHPRQSRFFRTAAVDPTNACPDCSRFIGDYNGIAIGADGASYHSVWTDMRRPVPPAVQRPVGCDDDPTTEAPPCVPTFLRTEDAYYARRPVHPFAPPAENPFPGTPGP